VALRQAGHRSSVPRSAVVELIGKQDCVLTAHEIADELRRRGREVGTATVYRTLELLEELKLVQRLDVGGTSARYEPALPGGEHHHHHLVCDRCGRVTPFEDPRLERAIESLASRLDYRVGDHDVILKGKCPTCARVAA
jgi:Fur family transcriptional regulator, ferric uptake regulator